MKFEFANCDGKLKGTILAPVLQGASVPPRLLEEDKQGLIAKAMKAQNFTGKSGETCSVFINDLWLVLMGADPFEEPSAPWLQALGGHLAGLLSSLRQKEVMVCTSGLAQKMDMPAGKIAAHLAFGMGLGSYSFDVYKTEEKETQTVEKVVILSSDAEACEKAFEPLFAVLNGVYEARDLTTEPANMLSPGEFVEAVKALKLKGVTVKVLNKKQMEKLGMNLLLSVAKGAQEEPYLLVLEYLKGKKKQAPVLLVGKGVCFDSGGMNLKPSQHLSHMKYDMAGGAAVVGTLSAVSQMGLKENIVGVIPLVENMLSGHAMHTDDVVQSMSGKTVEVGNTDAEGRLILADALWYGQETYHPSIAIDIATLTGGMKFVLGSEYAALFSNHKALAEDLLKAADQTVMDKLWELPLHPSFAKMLKSDIADMNNISSANEAGSSTAAMFIQQFVQENVQWAHLDIAGVCWLNPGKPCAPKGATGFGVQLLTQYFVDKGRS